MKVSRRETWEKGAIRKGKEWERRTDWGVRAYVQSPLYASMGMALHAKLKKKINEDQKELKRKQYISNCCFNICILSIYISSDKKLLLLIQLLGLKLFINLPLRPFNHGGSQMGLSFCGRLSNEHDGTSRCVVYWRMTMSFTSNRSPLSSWIGRL